MQIGLYFGSFNPIHTGHLIIASHVHSEAHLDKLWFVVSPQNPFKPSTSLLNEYDRLHLVQKAVEDDDRFRALDVEFNLPRPSYTAHTLAHLTDRYPEHQFHIVMGSDSFQNLQNWNNAEAIISHYPILVYLRPEFAVTETHGANVTILKAPLLEISATHIRELVQRGKSIRYLVPDVVADEISKSSFYRK
jgi:nicotinate-nucleotide adenylyltransferase